VNVQAPADIDTSFPAVLLAALDDDDDRSRRACASVAMLGLAAPESVAPAMAGLASRLFDPAASLRRRCDLAGAVAAACASFTASLVERLSSELDDDVVVAARALAAPAHLEAVPALARVLSSTSSPAARVAAVDAIAAIGDCSAVADVAALVDDDDASVRRAAVTALRVLDGTRARAGDFARAAVDSDVDVRCAALTALLVVGGSPACAAARTALQDESGAVRALAVVTLAKHGASRDRARLRSLSGDADARVRRALAEACGSL
jgi:HEAT repeat protein